MYTPRQSQVDICLTHIDAELEVRSLMERFVLGLKPTVQFRDHPLQQIISAIQTDTYEYQFVNVIITYKVAKANMTWKNDQEYATPSSSLSHTLWPLLPDSPSSLFSDSIKFRSMNQSKIYSNLRQTLVSNDHINLPAPVS